MKKNQWQKLSLSITLALFISLLMPMTLLAAGNSSQKDSLEARIAQYNDSHQGSTDVETQIEIYEEPVFDPSIMLSLQKDMLFAMERMVGVLDRYGGDGFPQHCDEYIGYYIILDSIMFEFFFLDIPDDWIDIAIITIDSGVIVLEGTTDTVSLCANGGNGALSEHNRAVSRIALTDGMQKLRTAIQATEERGVVSAESFLEEIVTETNAGEQIEDLWRQNGPFEFNTTTLYLDMLLSRLIMEHIGGVYDRLLAGQTADCDYLLFLLDLLAQPVIFDDVPVEWEPIYNGHLDSVLTVLDTSDPMAWLCWNGGATADAAQVRNARAGITRAMNMLDMWIEVLEERAGVTRHL